VVSDSAQDELGQLAEAFEQMRQRLATLERARSEFIANASHELRTPLFALGGFLELLTGEDHVDAETRDEFLEAMRGQVSRLTVLASVLLDLSRIDAGRLGVETGAVDLEEVASTLVSDFQPRARGADHELSLTVRGRPQVLADEQRVLQIGRILVENAILHTAPGVKIEVEVSEPGRRGVLAVSDDGAGIPADAQRFVFERFFRLGGGVASGSGLGLAIASELAALMGGTIELTSVPGRTTFALALPEVAADRSQLEIGGRA
jgi:signal transduction histidine kinase